MGCSLAKPRRHVYDHSRLAAPPNYPSDADRGLYNASAYGRQLTEQYHSFQEQADNGGFTNNPSHGQIPTASITTHHLHPKPFSPYLNPARNSLSSSVDTSQTHQSQSLPSFPSYTLAHMSQYVSQLSSILFELSRFRNSSLVPWGDLETTSYASLLAQPTEADVASLLSNASLFCDTSETIMGYGLGGHVPIQEDQIESIRYISIMTISTIMEIFYGLINQANDLAVLCRGQSPEQQQQQAEPSPRQDASHTASRQDNTSPSAMLSSLNNLQQQQQRQHYRLPAETHEHEHQPKHQQQANQQQEWQQSDRSASQALVSDITPQQPSSTQQQPVYQLFPSQRPSVYASSRAYSTDSIFRHVPDTNVESRGTFQQQRATNSISSLPQTIPEHTEQLPSVHAPSPNQSSLAAASNSSSRLRIILRLTVMDFHLNQLQNFAAWLALVGPSANEALRNDLLRLQTRGSGLSEWIGTTVEDLKKLPDRTPLNMQQPSQQSQQQQQQSTSTAHRNTSHGDASGAVDDTDMMQDRLADTDEEHAVPSKRFRSSLDDTETANVSLAHRMHTGGSR